MGVTINNEPQTINPAGAPKLVHEPVSGGAGPARAEEDSEFQRLEDLARKVVAVPKKEVDEKRGKKG